MEEKLKKLFDQLASKNNTLRKEALDILLKKTEEKVDWFDDAFGVLIGKLDEDNSFQRSIGVMLLANLAKSDTTRVLAGYIDNIVGHTRDEKFITARQTIQNLWKFAVVNEEYKTTIVKHLTEQFADCIYGKHYNLIRLDIAQAMYDIYKVDGDDRLVEHIRELVEIEDDPKHKKKYLKVIGD